MQIPGQIPGNLADFGRAGAGECFFGRGRGPGRSLPSSDPKLVRKNADMNRREVQEAYKQKIDQLANTSILHPGDLVLMKRTFGSFPKLKVKLEEDAKGSPYTVIKKTSNVNYVIRNTTGMERTYHRNMLKPANIRVEPTCTAPTNAMSWAKQDAQTTLILFIY